MQGRLASETLSALAGTLAARPSSVLFDPHSTRVDPYQALISTYSYETTFDQTGAMLSGYDLMGAAGPTLRTFQYGVDGMPSRITYGSTSVDSYYDDTGTRVLKYGAQTTVYVGPHFEVRGGVRHRYVFANGTRIALLTPTTTYYFHGDHLGSTRAITNGAGATVWTGSYEPFGRLSSETGTRVSPYLFTGKELDGETGLYYFGARYYDPSSGMFTSADSVLARPYDPQSLNRYAYVGGKPLSRFDPDGHDWSDFTKWVEKGFRWLGQHSNGGFVPPVGAIDSNGVSLGGVPLSSQPGPYVTYVSMDLSKGATEALPRSLADPLISHGHGFLNSFDYISVGAGFYDWVGGGVHVTLDRNGYITWGLAGGGGLGGRGFGLSLGTYEGDPGSPIHGARPSAEQLRGLNTGWSTTFGAAFVPGIGGNLPWNSQYTATELQLQVPGFGLSVGKSWEITKVDWLTW